MTESLRADDFDDEGKTTLSTSTSMSLEPKRIERCERLFTLGVLATGLLHELNNPLNAILMNAELGLVKLQKSGHPDELLHILQKISQEARRGGDLTRRVAEFAHGQNHAPKESGDLNAAIMEARNLASSVVRRSAMQLHWEPNRELPTLNLNTTAMAQAIAHLLHNAAEAGASQVHIVTSGDAEKVTISVIDNGDGIRPELLSEIFKPFFTTRQAQGKIGLGLSVARRIVAEHHGKIEARSTPAETRFVMHLPV